MLPTDFERSKGRKEGRKEFALTHSLTVSVCVCVCVGGFWLLVPSWLVACFSVLVPSLVSGFWSLVSLTPTLTARVVLALPSVRWRVHWSPSHAHKPHVSLTLAPTVPTLTD